MSTVLPTESNELPLSAIIGAVVVVALLLVLVTVSGIVIRASLQYRNKKVVTTANEAYGLHSIAPTKSEEDKEKTSANGLHTDYTESGYGYENEYSYVYAGTKSSKGSKANGDVCLVSPNQACGVTTAGSSKQSRVNEAGCQVSSNQAYGVLSSKGEKALSVRIPLLPNQAYGITAAKEKEENQYEYVVSAAGSTIREEDIYY